MSELQQRNRNKKKQLFSTFFPSLKIINDNNCIKVRKELPCKFANGFSFVRFEESLILQKLFYDCVRSVYHYNFHNFH